MLIKLPVKQPKPTKRRGKGQRGPSVGAQGQRPPRLMPWPENTQALWQISENAGTGYSSAAMAMESPSKKNESSPERQVVFGSGAIQRLTERMEKRMQGVKLKAGK